MLAIISSFSSSRFFKDNVISLISFSETGDKWIFYKIWGQGNSLCWGGFFSCWGLANCDEKLLKFSPIVFSSVVNDPLLSFNLFWGTLTLFLLISFFIMDYVSLYWTVDISLSFSPKWLKYALHGCDLYIKQRFIIQFIPLLISWKYGRVYN